MYRYIFNYLSGYLLDHLHTNKFIYPAMSLSIQHICMCVSLYASKYRSILNYISYYVQPINLATVSVPKAYLIRELWRFGADDKKIKLGKDTRLKITRD